MTEEEMKTKIAEIEARAEKDREDLRRKADELMGETKAEREKRRAAEEAIAKAQSEAAERERQAAEAAGDIDKLKAQWERDWSGKVETERKARTEVESRLHRMAVDGGIRDALSASGVAPSLMKGALLEFKDGRQFEVGDDGVMVGGAPLASEVSKWAAESPYRAASLASGGGAPGGAGGGTGGLAEMTEAQRMELASKDPDAFKAMSRG